MSARAVRSAASRTSRTFSSSRPAPTKTFVLAQYLRDVEAGLLSEEEQLAIDDGVRTLASPVFLNLAGTTLARSVLEAMITHSDNIATGKIGADRVRALIAQAGLRA